jgi:alanyl-tRNA synthetase
LNAVTSEEFERYKEAEKEHLRKLKELKQALHGLEQRRAATSALNEMASSSREALDRNAELVERLAIDTAVAEARLDLALARSESPESVPPAPDPDEEMQKMRAAALVRQLKEEIGEEAGGESAASGTRPAELSQDSTHERETTTPPAAGKEQTDPLPEKTIGRMK